MCKPSLAVATVVLAVAIYVLPSHLLTQLHESSFAPPDTEIGVIDDITNDEQLAERLQGKHVLIVGGSRGIGLGAAMVLARVGAHVTIMSRSESSGEKAVKQILQHVQNTSKKQIDVKFLSGDFSTVNKAQNAAQKIKAQGIKYDHLIVTIGVFPDWEDPMNSDGIEKTVATMIVGRYVLLKDSLEFLHPDARVINVLFAGTKIEFDEISTKEFFETKPKSLLQVMGFLGALGDIVSRIFVEKWKDTNVKVIGTAPAWITTELHSGQGFFLDNILFPFMDTFAAVPLLDVGFQNAQYLASQKITKKLTFLDSHNVARSKTQKLEQIFMKDGPMLVEYFENLIKRNKQNKH